MFVPGIFVYDVFSSAGNSTILNAAFKRPNIPFLPLLNIALYKLVRNLTSFLS